MRIAEALEVSLDWLVGLTDLELDQPTLKRIEQLPPEQREKLFYLIDAVIRDAKTQKAYAS